MRYSGECTFERRERIRSSTPESFSSAEKSKNGCSYFSSSSRTLWIEVILLMAAPYLEAACYRACASRRACIRSRSSILLDDHDYDPGEQRQGAYHGRNRDRPLKQTDGNSVNSPHLRLRPFCPRHSRGLQQNTPRTWGAEPCTS